MATYPWGQRSIIIVPIMLDDRQNLVQNLHTFFTHPNFLVLFLTGRESQPSSLDSKWETNADFVSV